jgi:hypothetical protein
MRSPTRFKLDNFIEAKSDGDVRYEGTWGSFHNDPQIHIRTTLNADEVALFSFSTAGFRLAHDALTRKED